MLEEISFTKYESAAGKKLRPETKWFLPHTRVDAGGALPVALRRNWESHTRFINVQQNA
jgi:hypothetical protein